MFVIPGLVALTPLQSREDMHHPRPFASLFDDGFDPFFLTHPLVAQILDLQPILLGYLCYPAFDFISPANRLNAISPGITMTKGIRSFIKAAKTIPF